MATSGKSKSSTFEQAIEQLEQITDRIESGEVGLEEGLKQYEEGMKLIGRCRGILDAAEKRIAQLTTDSAGRLSEAGGGAVPSDSDRRQDDATTG